MLDNVEDWTVVIESNTLAQWYTETSFDVDEVVFVVVVFAALAAFVDSTI